MLLRMMSSYFRFQAIVGSLIVTTLLFCDAGTKSRPHPHKGILQPFTGDHIAYNISADQNKKLKAGEPVIINQRNGKSGGAIVLQDVNAPPNLCMDRIRDLGFYHKVLPSVKSVLTYSEEVYKNGTVKTGAQFNVAVSIIPFSYFVQLTFKPEFNTLTWTLDYQYTSDFDDNVGHWQVMPHPTKEGWSRVLYSCRLKLPNWIPDFVVTFLLKSAAIEATTWVKAESEKVVKQGKMGSVYEGVQQPNLAPCYQEFADESAAYDNSCASIIEAAEVASTTTATTVDPTIENGEGSGVAAEAAGESETKAEVSAQQEL